MSDKDNAGIDNKVSNSELIEPLWNEPPIRKNNRGYCMELLYGDCLEVMWQIPDESVGMVLCDLPYGTTACKWDTIIPFEPLWEHYNRVVKSGGAVVLFGSQPFTSALVMSNVKMFKHEVIWFKNVPTGMPQAAYAPMKYHENIVVFCKGKLKTFNKQMEQREGAGKDCYRYEHYCGESNHVKMNKVKKFYDAELVNPSSVQLYNVQPNRTGKLHPTQKPVPLCEYLIQTYSNEGDIILDNCMGSGTTGIACIRTGRKFIGIEKDQEHFSTACKRIKQELSQPQLSP